MQWKVENGETQMMVMKERGWNCLEGLLREIEGQRCVTIASRA